MTEVLLALPPDVLARVDAIAATTKDDVTLTLVGSQQRVVWGSAERARRQGDGTRRAAGDPRRGRAGRVRRLRARQSRSSDAD